EVAAGETVCGETTVLMSIDSVVMAPTTVSMQPVQFRRSFVLARKNQPNKILLAPARLFAGKNHLPRRHRRPRSQQVDARERGAGQPAGGVQPPGQPDHRHFAGDELPGAAVESIAGGEGR